MSYSGAEDAALANQIGNLNIGQPDNSYHGGYAVPPQHQPVTNYGYNSNYQQMPPVANQPPMQSHMAPQQPQYGQPQMQPPQQPYQGGFPPMGMMPPAPPGPQQPSIAQKAQSARALADIIPNAIEVSHLFDQVVSCISIQ